MSAALIIPARLESLRLPRKLLLEVGGKPVLRWTFEACMSANVGEVFVTTGDAEIERTVESWGGRTIRSEKVHHNGTSRVAEAVERLPCWVDTVINVQADEPLLNPHWLRQIIAATDHSDWQIATLVSQFTTVLDLQKANVVKAVVEAGVAHWFTRAPWPQSMRHIGVYAFRRRVFGSGRLLQPSELASEEKLEQLAWIVNGLRIAAVEVDASNHISIDTPEDLEAFKKAIST